MMSDPNPYSGNERSRHADTVINNHVIWAMGAGFIPIMLADIVAVTALQLDMIRQMSRIYNVSFQESQGKAIITSLTGTTLARVAAGSVAKAIPIVGSLVGGITVSAFAGASTYAIGQVFKRHFENGGTILDFDTERLKNFYKEQFEKGKKVAEELKEKDAVKDAPPPPAGFSVTNDAVSENKPSTPDLIEKLKELANLRDSGVITAEEFELVKAKMIEKYG